VGGSSPKRVKTWGEKMVVTDSGIEVAVERVLNITPTPDGIIIVQNEWDGRLKTWMIPSLKTLSWLIYEATAGETPPRIYHPPLNSIVLEREQIERFHIMAWPYEIKTQYEGDPLKSLEDL
jgi:hypothetical protein